MITFYHNAGPQKTLVIVNNGIMYNKDNLIMSVPMISNHQFHQFYLFTNSDNSKSFNGTFYDFSCLQNITEDEAY